VTGAGERGGTSDPRLAGSQPPAGEHEPSDTKVAESSPGATVPRLLQQSAAWSWRLLIIGLIIYVAFRLVQYLRLVTLPFIAALLFTALLEPLASWLRRRGVGTMLATWSCFLLASADAGCNPDQRRVPNTVR
jgi:putative heme transporter